MVVEVKDERRNPPTLFASAPKRFKAASIGGLNRRTHLSSSRRVYLNIVLTACQNDRPSRR
jgi:hypothetical protein